jgi:hypothetical protein
MEHESMLGLFIGLVVVTLSLSIPIVYIVTRSRRAQKAMDLIHAQRMAAIERGMELPPTSFDLNKNETAVPKTHTALLPGLMWLFVGIAIVAAWAVDHDLLPIFLGLIPMGIGLAYLIYYFVEERRSSKSS